MKTSFYALFGKRIFDMAAALAMIITLTPIIIVIAILVKHKLGTPVLFRQLRSGLQGRPFTIYKFRTMSQQITEPGKLISDERRLTQLGRFLRSASLDELPSLLNVLKGDMSIVGPRPLLIEYLPFYSPEQFRRHEVRPGISGWAQVNGRNLLDWEKKFELDIWYVDHQSFWLDIKILALTLWKVVRREGVNAAGDKVTSRFNGTLDSEK